MTPTTQAGLTFNPISDDDLIREVDNWLQYRQCHMGTPAQLKKVELNEREARIRLANKAAEWAYTRRSIPAPDAERVSSEIEKWLITIKAHCTVIADPSPTDDIRELAACIKINVDDELRPLINRQAADIASLKEKVAELQEDLDAAIEFPVVTKL